MKNQSNALLVLKNIDSHVISNWKKRWTEMKLILRNVSDT